MNLPDEILIEMTYVKLSTYRTKVVKALYAEVKFPVQISNETGILLNRTSMTLGQLKEHDLVECINPEARKGKFYRLTELGEKVAEQLILK